MKPIHTLAEARTPDGSRLTLQEHDGDIFLRLNGRQVMSSAAVASEVQLAEIACDFSPRIANPRILVGGLGLGFTLRRVLELAGAHAVVHVAECMGEVVAWNRELLGPENLAPLKDPRVSVMITDVFKIIKKATGKADRYDAILLDVDNGPVAMVTSENQRLYSRRGVATIVSALKPGGRLAVWSADDDKPFFERLQREGLSVQSFDAKSHERAKRAAHRIYLGENCNTGPIECEEKTPPPDAGSKRRPVGNPAPKRLATPRGANSGNRRESQEPSPRQKGQGAPLPQAG